MPSLNPTAPPPSLRVVVCKDGAAPAGTYDFTVAQEGGRGGALLAGAAFTLVPGECVDVWEALPNPPNPDPAVMVTVAEGPVPDGVVYDSLVIDSDAEGRSSTTDMSGAMRVNYFHGGTFTFFQHAAPPPPPSGEGCTPGFWKNPKRFGLWTAPYVPGAQFADFFEDAFPGMTLEDVIRLGGGDLNALGRHTVAALLSAASSEVDYGMTPAQVIAEFNDAFPGGDIEGTKNTFDELNNRGSNICQ